MPHPGKIVFAHEPYTDGWRFLRVVYRPQEGTYALRYQPVGGEPEQVEGTANEVVFHLEQELTVAFPTAAEVARRAAAQVRAYAESHPEG